MFRASHDDEDRACYDEQPLVAPCAEGVDKPVTGEVIECSVEESGCTFTRPELQDLLKDSRFGAELAPYNAWIRPDPSGDGGHVCRACGRAVGCHRVFVAAAAAAAAATAQVASSEEETLRKIPPPNIGADECLRPPIIHPHYFVDADSDVAAKWLTFLDFDGFAGIHRDRKGREFARARWRCVAPSGDGGPCGATFITEGAFLDPMTALPKPRLAMGMRVISDDGSTTPAAHFAEHHQLEHVVVGRWGTGLTECCEDPKVACAYVACPYAFGTGISQVRPDTVTCSGECIASYMIASPLLIFVETVMFVVSVVTACGFPCDSESIPPMCFKAYANRRALVGALGVDESAMRTRCITVFCLPCSECQRFREQRNSGVWLGLLCCTASDRDRAIMAPSAVRARYTVDGYYGVRPKAGAAPHAQEAAALMRRDGDLRPLVGWRME